MNTSDWFSIATVDKIDSPALVIYADRVAENISRLINSIDRVDRLRPHVKTHKSPQVSKMMLQAGIAKFKCATIAEAEMLASVGAKDVLLAYQPVGPKAARLLELAQKFSATTFSCLVDDEDAAAHLANVFHSAKRNVDVYIDLNVGMNRTGIVPSKAFVLLQHCAATPGLRLVGLHAYDGHLRDPDISIRTKQCDEAFEPVTNLQREAKQKLAIDLRIVAGGTPTYSIHKNRQDVECSPGTFIYWDKGYEQILQEQQYLHAALVITRVISKPSEGVLCVDLGHKAIASENPLANRVTFLNHAELIPTGHSEEHMVLTTNRWNDYHVGDVLYGIPYHVCPTIALHDEATVVRNHAIVDRWTNESRKRKINV